MRLGPQQPSPKSVFLDKLRRLNDELSQLGLEDDLTQFGDELTQLRLEKELKELRDGIERVQTRDETKSGSKASTTASGLMTPLTDESKSDKMEMDLFDLFDVLETDLDCQSIWEEPKDVRKDIIKIINDVRARGNRRRQIDDDRSVGRLSPLLSLHTGEEIPQIPSTIKLVWTMSRADCDAILTALDIPVYKKKEIPPLVELRKRVARAVGVSAPNPDADNGWARAIEALKASDDRISKLIQAGKPSSATTMGSPRRGRYTIDEELIMGSPRRGRNTIDEELIQGSPYPYEGCKDRCCNNKTTTTTTTAPFNPYGTSYPRYPYQANANRSQLEDILNSDGSSSSRSRNNYSSPTMSGGNRPRFKGVNTYDGFPYYRDTGMYPGQPYHHGEERDAFVPFPGFDSSASSSRYPRRGLNSTPPGAARLSPLRPPPPAPPAPAPGSLASAVAAQAAGGGAAPARSEMGAKFRAFHGLI